VSAFELETTTLRDRCELLKRAAYLLPALLTVHTASATGMHRSPKPDPWDDGKTDPKITAQRVDKAAEKSIR
jgi:hypothetical protein